MWGSCQEVCRTIWESAAMFFYFSPAKPFATQPVINTVAIQKGVTRIGILNGIIMHSDLSENRKR